MGISLNGALDRHQASGLADVIRLLEGECRLANHKPCLVPTLAVCTPPPLYGQVSRRAHLSRLQLLPLMQPTFSPCMCGMLLFKSSLPETQATSCPPLPRWLHKTGCASFQLAEYSIRLSQHPLWSQPTWVMLWRSAIHVTNYCPAAASTLADGANSRHNEHIGELVMF